MPPCYNRIPIVTVVHCHCSVIVPLPYRFGPHSCSTCDSTVSVDSAIGSVVATVAAAVAPAKNVTTTGVVVNLR
jgi:hypothetical protein